MTTATMGKEASLEGLEFDGDTVLCRVCGDKASGFHYGVHACEGCKGFFRRSIQQKIQYRPCLKNQQCNIMRVNRNRCQYCRLKKCISVGMSRDAVRFGRVPKKEKARIIEQMQKSNLQIATTAMSSVLLSSQDLVQSVILAHRQTCDLGQEKAKLMRGIALLQKDYVDCPAHMACPLNSCAGNESTDNQDWSDFSEYFAPAIKSVVDFAKLIPGFLMLNQDDQITLLKAATFEVLLVRMACLFDNESNTMMFASGKLFRRQTTGLSTSVGFLLDSMFDFAERFNKLNLSDDELALFSAIVLLSPDRPGVRQIDQVEKIQNKLTESLQNMTNASHKEDSTLFAKLLMKTTDLRTLNALHAEKTVGSGDKAEETLEMHDSPIDSRSEDSTPSDSSSSLTAHTSNMETSSASSMYDSNGSLAHAQGRFPADQHQQQIVLKTPYGTFYREDTGYYGMMPEQPRRRCHTLDRDTQISRPRLHTIEEGSRRRYTMDREYINKMVSKLSDRLEKRAHVNSMPGSVNNSAASSPVPILEEQYKLLNTNRDFIPISTPDSSACSSRTSPSCHKDTLQPFASSPNSPRQRSGSMGTEDFGQMRPRCSSVSEGHGRAFPGEQDYFGQDGQHYRMSAEMRRGSVGASYNLHARKKSLLVDRSPAYLTQGDLLFRKSDKQRSPLAVDETNKFRPIGSSESAFEQVPRLQIPTSVTWGSKILDHQEPPRVSVTGPEESLSEHSFGHLGVPNSDAASAVSPQGSARNSPEMEIKNEEVYHKKFDKLRKHASHSTPEETKRMENLSIHDVESMESDFNEDSEAKVKSEKSVSDAHPQLLAQLKSGPHFQPAVHPAFPATYQQYPSVMPNPNVQFEQKTHENGTIPNVVLTVPQTPFVSHSPPSQSPVNSMTGSSPVHTTSSRNRCLESLLRNNASPRSGEQFLIADNSQKDKVHVVKYPSSESLNKCENEYAGYPNGHPSTQPMLAAFQGRGFDPAVVQHHMAMYPQLYSGQRGMVPQFNQHLAGMQQLVYGNPQQLRRSSGGDIPLNLVHGPIYSEASETSGGGEMIQKIKEEVLS